jgi:hypothetical protein
MARVSAVAASARVNNGLLDLIAAPPLIPSVSHHFENDRGCDPVTVEIAVVGTHPW